MTIVDNERVETPLRTLVHHFAAIGGIPLLAVFDRPKTVALHWAKDGTITEWNPTFAAVALDLGMGVEVCWPRRGRPEGIARKPRNTPGPDGPQVHETTKNGGAGN